MISTRQKLIASFFCVLFFATNLPADQAQTLKVHFLDVGYGDSILIELPGGKNILMDAGDKKEGGVVQRYLRKIKISQIDTAVITHPHKNHFGGFLKLLGTIPIKKFLINPDTQGERGYSELLGKIKKQKIPLEDLSPSTMISDSPNEIEIKILNAFDPSQGNNDNSSVILLNYGNTSFFFAADIEAGQQAQIAKKIFQLNDKQCVKVPHHGRPMDENFLSRFSSPIWIISTGKNPQGFPKDEELKKLNGPVLRTDIRGTIVLESDGENIKIIKPPL